MKRLHRSRLLLKGLPLRAAMKCIITYIKLKLNKKIKSYNIKYVKFNKNIKIKVRGSHINSDLQSIIELAAGDCYKINEINWQPDFIIDGGGNTGLFSLMAHAKWPNSYIYCFEPMPENVDVIKENIILNNIGECFKLYPNAIGDKNIKTKFYLREANQGSIDNLLSFKAVIDIDVIRLWDVYMHIRKKKVLIKLDIEGAEFEILNDFFSKDNLKNLVFLMEVHGNKIRQNELMQKAKLAGFSGNYWEQANETAHLLLHSEDVKL